MQSVAKQIAQQLRSGDVITLNGEVGAGKTSFAGALIKAIVMGSPEVTSPTFTLMQSYPVQLADGKREIIWHLDLYRLVYEQEAAMLGLEELWGHIVLIEWPQLIQKMLPQSHLAVTFDFDVPDQTRTLGFTGDSVWQTRLKGLT